MVDQRLAAGQLWDGVADQLSSRCRRRRCRWWSRDRGDRNEDEQPWQGGPVGSGSAGIGAGNLAGTGAALGALVLVVSALASLWLFTSGSERTEVLALANTVERGEPLELADLVTVEIASDDAIVVLRPDQAATMTGRVALVDLAGELVTPSQFTSAGATLEPGQSVVGVDVPAGQVPSTRLAPGSLVSVILTPDASVDLADDPGVVLVEAAEVVEVVRTAGPGEVFVALLVSEDDARVVASAASQDRVRLVQVAR